MCAGCRTATEVRLEARPYTEAVALYEVFAKNDPHIEILASYTHTRGLRNDPEQSFYSSHFPSSVSEANFFIFYTNPMNGE